MAAGPLAAATPVATACPSPGDAFSDIPSAFAFELTDPHVMQFMTEIASATPASAHETLEAILRSAGTPEQSRAASVVERVCPTRADLAAQVRADRIVTDLWNLDDVDTDAKGEAIAQAVENAVLVLGHGPAFTAADAAPILRPFAAIALPAAPAGAPCSTPNADASTSHIAPLRYPAISAALNASGRVSLRVALSANGDVRSVSVVKDGTGGGSGTQALVNAAIAAAADTTYHPEVVNCVGRPGLYLFQANFSRK